MRLYSLAGGLSCHPGSALPLASHRMAAKLSCLSWSRHAGGAARVTVADYDGDLTVLDLTTGHHAYAADGHHGRRWGAPTRAHLPPPHFFLSLSTRWGSRRVGTVREHRVSAFERNCRSWMLRVMFACALLQLLAFLYVGKVSFSRFVFMCMYRDGKLVWLVFAMLYCAC